MARRARGSAAVTYARFSDEKQGSIEEQNGINKELADLYGNPIVAGFSDAGVSRTIQDRPGLMEMFEFIRAHHEVGFIIVNELERLTAGVAQRAEVVDVCQRLNVWLITEDMDPIDPFDEDAMHEADQRAVAAKGEVLKVRRRTRRNLRQKVINGTVAMRPAYGTRMKPLVVDGVQLRSGARIVDTRGRVVRSGELEIHTDELPWLLKIFEWADADVSAEEIARRLTAERVPTKSGNSTWRANTVIGILTNPLYKGEMTWGKQAVRRYSNGRTYLELREDDDPGRVTKPSPLGAIIDPAAWDRIAARRESRRGLRAHHRRTNGSLLLDGFVYCGRCGSKCYARRDNLNSAAPRWRYFCSGARTNFSQRPGFDAPCTTAYSMAAHHILDALASFRTSPARVTARPTRSAPVADHDARKRLEAQIAQAERERENAQRLAIAGKVSEAILDEVLHDTQVRIDIARDKLAALNQQGDAELANAYLANNLDAMAELAALLADDTIPLDDRRAALRDLGIERLYIDRPNVQVEFLLGDPGLQS